mgnify:CR=1 FL=1
MADERKRFYKGSGIAKHREWRGLKDTFYDYLQWAVNLGILVQFAAKSPVRIVKGLFEYRWFGGYIGALHMTDKCTAGLRGPALRTAHIQMHAIMKGTTGMLADSMIGDRRFDIEGAAAAGVESIGVLWGYGSREELEKASPGYLAADIPELRRLLA